MVRLIRLSLMSLFAILLVSTEVEAGAKKRQKADTAPSVNIDYWAFDPQLGILKFTSADTKEVRIIDLRDDVVRQFIALPQDHAVFYIDLFQTGCRDWRDGAYRRVDEWNRKNPTAKVLLQSNP